MKKLLLLAGLLVAAVGSYAQGTVNFANGGAGVNAPVTYIAPGGSSALATSANGVYAMLFIGPAGATDLTTLTTNGVSGAPALVGGTAGYFFGGARTITGFTSGQTVTAQVRLWVTPNASGYSGDPSVRNEGLYATSNPIQVTLGGGTTGTPNMVGLQAMTIGPVPEPSAIALGLLGLGAVALIRRRK
jgi:MYXO-CTERM domain-containing protein